MLFLNGVILLLLLPWIQAVPLASPLTHANSMGEVVQQQQRAIEAFRVFYEEFQQKHGDLVEKIDNEAITLEDILTSLENQEEEEELESWLDPCDPKKCKAKFTSLAAPVTIPCDYASGHMPQRPALPLVFPGQYDLCHQFQFAGAHFCVVNTDGFIAPVLREEDKTEVFPVPVDYVYAGNVHFGLCVPEGCTDTRIRKKFRKHLRDLAFEVVGEKLFKKAQLRGDILAIANYLDKSMTVNCMKNDQVNHKEEYEVMGTMLFFFLTGILFIICITTSFIHCLYPSSKQFFITTFSMIGNAQTLVYPMKGDMVFLNGVRVISMAWVVYGHTVVYTLSQGVPLLNPSYVDRQTQSFQMTIVRGGEYSVDTFFFMSGLLATAQLLDVLQSGRMEKIGFKSYFGLVFARFLRLTPVYMYVMFFYIKALSFCGNGPYWHVSVNQKQIEASCSDSWTNFLYINNLYPYGPEGGLQGCMGWTWYLANDMQFFLLVPFLVTMFLSQWNHMENDPPNSISNTGFIRWIRLFGPCVGIILIQIGITLWTVDYYDVWGVFDDSYSAYLYVKPWCRVAPYAVGCYLAFYRFNKKHAKKSSSTRSVSPTSNGDEEEASRSGGGCQRCRPHLIALLGVGLTAVVQFSLYDDFRCKAEPSSDCNIYGSIRLYGDLALGNWSHIWRMLYLSCTYVAWGVACAILTNYAADGYGGIITRTLAHPVFSPLARLSYTVYMIHLIVITVFVARNPTPRGTSMERQFMDAIAYVVITFCFAFILYLLVERPCTTLLPALFGLSKSNRPKTQHQTQQERQERQQDQQQEPMPLHRELSMVSDLDSESVILSTPVRRPSMEEPLLHSNSRRSMSNAAVTGN